MTTMTSIETTSTSTTTTPLSPEKATTMNAQHRNQQQRNPHQLSLSLPGRISRRLGKIFKPPRSPQPSRRSNEFESPMGSSIDDGRDMETDSHNVKSKAINRMFWGVHIKKRTSLFSRLNPFSDNTRTPTIDLASTPNNDISLELDLPGRETIAEPNQNTKTMILVSPDDNFDIQPGPEPADLTNEQRELLRTSWEVIKQDVNDVGVETFMGLFNTHPHAMDSFLAFKDYHKHDIVNSVVLKEHALRVMQTVDKCVSRLNDMDKMTTVLTNLGKRHVSYRANSALIPLIGQQFLQAIEPKMAGAWTSDIEAAWKSLFSIINYNIRKGMAMGISEKQRS